MYEENQEQQASESECRETGGDRFMILGGKAGVGGPLH